MSLTRLPYSNSTKGDAMRSGITILTAVVLGVALLLAPVDFGAVFAGEAAVLKKPGSVEERRLLYSLGEERARLQAEYEARAGKLDTREIALKTLAGEVDKKLMELKKLRETLQQLLEARDDAGAKLVKRLSRTYAKMQSSQAGRLLTELDQDLAVDILVGMDPKAAAKILDTVPVGTAVSLSLAYSSLEKK